MQTGLYRLARRLSIGRVLRYAVLWLRYFWCRLRSAPSSGGDQVERVDPARQVAALTDADALSASRIAIDSWFPLDLGNQRLYAAIVASLADARAELGITPEVIGHVLRLKASGDFTVCVDALAAEGHSSSAINTALYILLLRRLPAAEEFSMINSRHPRHALIAIQSGDEFQKRGRRTIKS